MYDVKNSSWAEIKLISLVARFQELEQIKLNIHWALVWPITSTGYKFYTSLLILTIWNRINSSWLVCTRHTGTNWLIHMALQKFQRFLDLNNFLLRSTYYDRLLWVPSNGVRNIPSPGVYHKHFNFDELIFCNVYLDFHWLKVHLMYWTFVSTLLIYILPKMDFNDKWNTLAH